MQVARLHLVNAVATLLLAGLMAAFCYGLRLAAADPVSWLYALGYGLVVASPAGLVRSWRDAGELA